METDDFRYLLEEVRVFHRNLQRDPESRRGIDATRHKQDKVDKLKNDFLKIKNRFNVGNFSAKIKTEVKEYCNGINKYLEAIGNILEERLTVSSIQKSSCSSEENFSDIKKMDFDFKIASQIIPEFSGESDKVIDFIDTVEYYHDSLKDDDNKNALLKLILKTKLKGKAKNSIISTPNSFIELKTILIDRFKKRTTLASIQYALGNCKQLEKTVSNFASEIESLINELNLLCITPQNVNARETVLQLNDQQGLNAFKSGLKKDIQTVVLASRVDTFTKAVEIALDTEISLGHSTQFSHNNVYNINRRRARGRNRYPRNSFRGNFRENQDRTYHNNNYNSRNNYYSSNNTTTTSADQSRGQNFRGNHNFIRGRRNFRYRGSRGNFQNVHLTQSNSGNGANQLSHNQTSTVGELGQN